MTDNKVMCNWAPHCENIYCVHRHPHSAYPNPSKNGKPQCEDKGVFCYSENRDVNCVEVR